MILAFDTFLGNDKERKKEIILKEIQIILTSR
jgi:hypothetical protein